MGRWGDRAEKTAYIAFLIVMRQIQFSYPNSRLPIPYSLLPTPYSLLPLLYKKLQIINKND
ncbi:MAG: hypothetical protein F6K26_28620 [Moorea sp. SIO2I5]|nr:hypothetical protein [Moorena sp. SIO2I5]